MLNYFRTRYRAKGKLGKQVAAAFAELGRRLENMQGENGVKIFAQGDRLIFRGPDVDEYEPPDAPWTLIPRRDPENDAQVLVRVYPAYFKGPVADAFDFEPTLSATSIWDDEYPEATLSVAGYHYFYALAETDENGDLEGVTIASYLQGTDTFPVDIIPDPWTPDDGLYAVEIGIVRVTITTGVASAERYRQYLDNHVQFRAAPNGFGLLLPTV